MSTLVDLSYLKQVRKDEAFFKLAENFKKTRQEIKHLNAYKSRKTFK